jgi:Uma2 family endonuclease
MNLALNEIELPIRLRTAVPMSDLELMRFCAANETLRVEREPNGEILVMTPRRPEDQQNECTHRSPSR